MGFFEEIHQDRKTMKTTKVKAFKNITNVVWANAIAKSLRKQAQKSKKDAIIIKSINFIFDISFFFICLY